MLTDNHTEILKTGTQRESRSNPFRKIVMLFGTRPEAIKLAPVIFGLNANRGFQTVVVSSSQHTDLLAPFLDIFGLDIDYDLNVMTEDQSPNRVCARVLESFDEVLAAEGPDAVLVQGDTTTALAGAIAAFNRKIRVGHVEAGLRSGNPQSPFPEEMNRRTISQIATLHFAATEGNRLNLLRENVDSSKIYVTGNPVVDALEYIIAASSPGKAFRDLLDRTQGLKRLLLTTHRRESFGETMSGNLTELARFVSLHQDVCLIFPVHPNPNVRRVTEEILAGRERVHLIEPLDYIDFITLQKSAWLIVSDSGGVQEEAPSLGKPLLVLRENTERPEALESGVAKLVGGDPKTLAKMLETNYNDETWINSVRGNRNPFGNGDSALKIVKVLEELIPAKLPDCE